MNGRAARAVSAWAACMVWSVAAQAEVTTMRAGGVTWLRGGVVTSHARPTPLALPSTSRSASLPDDSRAMPYIGLPGAFHRLVAHVAAPVPATAAMQAVLPLVTRAASDFRMDPALLLAVIHAESGFNPEALSPRGAVGLMQLMPATAGRYGTDDPREPARNVRAGAAHLQYLLGRYGDLSLALAAYNAGEGAVERHGMRIPPYAETQQYVPRVMALYRDYQSRLPGAAAAVAADVSTYRP